MIKEIVATGLSKNDKSNRDEDFGIINLNNDLACPFLNKEGYCKLLLRWVNIVYQRHAKTIRE